MAAMAASSSSETSSTSSGAKSENLGQVSEKVRKCIRALEAAETDTEKFATLFLVPKLVRGTECNKEARLGLMKIFQYEDASELLLNLLLTNGHLCWAYHNAFKDFNDLMGKLCTEFANSQDENKFEMCDTIRTVLRSYPKASFQ